MLTGALLMLQAVAGSWVYADKIDPITDLRGGSARLRSLDGQSTLIFTCNTNNTDQLLSVQYLPGRHLGSRDNVVAVRPDSGDYYSTQWTYTYKGAYLSEGAEIWVVLGMLRQARRFYVRALDYEDQPVDAVFETDGASEPMQKVLAACGKPAMTVSPVGKVK